MTPFESQLAALQKTRPAVTSTDLPSGAKLITIPDFDLPDGWSVRTTTVYFLAPAGYPAAQPDCFWVETKALRLQPDRTPQGTNDSNPIPEVGMKGTWFSWHLQGWNPNSDSLETYLKVIKNRFDDKR